jgi:hypothetical protein
MAWSRIAVPPDNKADAGDNKEDAGNEFGLLFRNYPVNPRSEFMKLMRYLAAFSMLIAGPAMADMLDVNLNNNTAQFQYSTASSVNAQGKADIHGGLLYNNNNSMLANIGVMVTNNLEAAPGTSVGIGMEALAANIKDNPGVTSNSTALALDALVRVSPSTAPQVGIAGELHYAPRILTFGDAVRFTQGIVRLEYELAPSSVVYVGYRRTSFGIKNAQAAQLDSGVHIGFKIAF